MGSFFFFLGFFLFEETLHLSREEKEIRSFVDVDISRHFFLF